MFSLILTIVSIALVVALIAATMYYGSDVLTRGQSAAQAAAIVSGGEQVMAAISTYYANTGRYPEHLSDLIAENYLASFPTFASVGFELVSSAYAAPVDGVGDWLYDHVVPHLAYVGTIDMATCAEVNNQTTQRPIVLSVLDPEPRAQCVVRGSQAPVVVFRHPGEKDFTGWPDDPRIPPMGPTGIQKDTYTDVLEGTYDESSGVCLYNCTQDESPTTPEPGDGSGGDTEPPAFEPETIEPAVKPGPWVQEGDAYCSPPIADDSASTIEFEPVVTEAETMVTITGEVYVSSEEDYDLVELLAVKNGAQVVFDDYSGINGNWTAFSYSKTVPAGTAMGFNARYVKDYSYGEGEDRACVRNVSIQLGEPEAPGPAEPPSIVAKCAVDGFSFKYYDGLTPEGYSGGDSNYGSCTPFLFPSTFDEFALSTFSYAQLTGTGFDPLEMTQLQYRHTGDRSEPGVYTRSRLYSGVPAQTALLTVYGTGGEIGSMPVELVKPLRIARYVRTDIGTALYAPGSTPTYDLVLENVQPGSVIKHWEDVGYSSPKLQFVDQDTVKILNTLQLSGTILTYDERDFLGTMSSGLHGYRFWGGVKTQYSSSPECVDPSPAVTTFEVLTSEPRTIDISFLDLEEAGPHQIVMAGPITASVVASSQAPIDESELSGITIAETTNTGVVRYTYSVQVNATGSGAGSVKFKNKFGWQTPATIWVDATMTDAYTAASCR